MANTFKQINFAAEPASAGTPNVMNTEEIIRRAVDDDDNLKKYFLNMKEIKTIYIKNKLINFVLQAS